MPEPNGQETPTGEGQPKTPETEERSSQSQLGQLFGEELDPREVLRREAQSIVASELNKAVGGLQRWRKGIEERVGTFDDTVKRLQGAGILAADADITALRQQVQTEALASDPFGEPEGKPEPTGEPPGPEGAPDNPITHAGRVLAARYGLTQEDPEATMIKIDGTPEEYLDSIVAAGSKKLTRTKGQTDLSPDGDKIEPSDMGIGGRSDKPNPIEDINDPDKLLDMALYG